MVMRVTQQSLYGTVISQANSTLLSVVETNAQIASEKRINKPSDDPSGTVTVLNTRADISRYTQYQSNITQASGWLTQEDDTLSSVSTLVTSIKSLAEEAATGTMTDDNRQEIASQVRQYFEQLISLANTTYSGSSLFAGQKTDTEAFAESLWMTSNDDTFSSAVASNGGFTITGDADYTVLVQFTSSNATTTHQPSFRYSLDGGDTWVSNGTYSTSASGDSQILNLGTGLSIEVPNAALDKVTSCSSTDDANGTWMWIRPTAVYQGNDNDTVTVSSLNNKTVTGSASGTFSSNVVVRVDQDTNFAAGSTFSYSYSLDGGSTWDTGNTSGVCTGSNATISVPGGILTLSANGGSLSSGSEYVIQPSTADISISLSDSDSVVVNGVGKDIFGGVYQAAGASNASVVTFSGSDASNLFETVGKLVGYLETNNQDGISECVADLTSSQERIEVALTSVGGKENRVSTAETMVESLSSNSTTTLSNVEDADITTLVTKLAQQELAYQAVLKTSSMVISMSLLNYI